MMEDQLQKIATESNTTIEYNSRLFVLESLLKRMSYIILQKKEVDFIFRGSLVLRNWVYPHRRIVKDLDLLGTMPYDKEVCKDLLCDAINLSNFNDNIVFDAQGIVLVETWQNTEFPGVKITLPYHFLGENNAIQMDFGFNDTIYPAPIIMDYKAIFGETFSFPTVPFEVALAWKVHGLVEFWYLDKAAWSSKTLYDIHLMINHLAIDKTVFQQIIWIAFEERKTPLWNCQELLRQGFGTSRRSRKSWGKFFRKYGITTMTKTNIELLEEHSPFLDEFLVDKQ